jgi:hypothetical protein
VKTKGLFISVLLVIDTFLVSYAAGFNSNSVLVVDPTLPPYKAPEVAAPAASSSEKDSTKGVPQPSQTPEHTKVNESKLVKKSPAPASEKTKPHGKSKSTASKTPPQATKSQKHATKAKSAPKTEAPADSPQVKS